MTEPEQDQQGQDDELVERPEDQRGGEDDAEVDQNDGVREPEGGEA